MPKLVTAIVEQEGVVLAVGTNWHAQCKRIGSKSGKDYSKCPGCMPHNHAEQKALAQFVYFDEICKSWQQLDLHGRGLVMHVYGHTRVCDDCLKATHARGVKVVLH